MNKIELLVKRFFRSLLY